MHNEPECELPRDKLGVDWAKREIECARDWFAKELLDQGVAHAMSVLGNRGFRQIEHAEDAVSEWICGRTNRDAQLESPRFLRAVRNFDPTKGTFESFLLADLRLYVSGIYLRRILSELVHDPLDEWVVSDPKSKNSNEILVKDLALYVLEKLDAREREILLFVDKGYSTLEISRSMNVSEGAVKTAVSRARKHARDIMEEQASE